MSRPVVHWEISGRDMPLVAPTAINESASFAMFRDPEGNVVGLLKQSGPSSA